MRSPHPRIFQTFSLHKFLVLFEIADQTLPLGSFRASQTYIILVKHPEHQGGELGGVSVGEELGGEEEEEEEEEKGEKGEEMEEEEQSIRGVGAWGGSGWS